MAASLGYGKTVTSGSVFAYDVADTRNSYIGEPTTNLALFGMEGSFNTDYSANCTFYNDPGKGYKGRDAKKVIATGGQWNIYRYPRSGNYTATSSTVFTYSFKIKWNDNHTPYFSNGYLYVDATTTYPGITVVPIDDGWFLCYCTYNDVSSPPWLTGFTTPDSGTCWVCDWQLEAKSHPTPYVGAGGTRSATQGLLPLVNNSTLDLSNVSFDSNAQMTFDGTSNYINIPSSTVFDVSEVTVEVVVKPNGLTQYGFWFEKGAVNTQYSLFMEGSNIVWRQAVNSQYTATSNMTNNAWNHVVGTFKSGERITYVNGVAKTADSLSYTLNVNQGNQFIGSYNSGGYYYNGQIAIVKVYNRVLTAGEVKQNYNKYKTRFNLS